MRRIVLPLVCGLLLTACGDTDPATRDTVGAIGPAATPAAGAADTGARAVGAPAGDGSAIAEMRDRQGRMLGTLTVGEGAGGIAISGRLTGLTPGERAIHIHTVGRCEPPFESAGSHWNPTTRQHGTMNPQGPHHGDLPNLAVASDGSVAVDVRTPAGTLRGNDALLDGDGASLVIHEGADDYRTDPSGNSGDRIACGVITPR